MCDIFHLVACFQVHLKHTDATNPAQPYVQIYSPPYKLGEWCHIGWTHYNGVSTCYRNGCVIWKNSNKGSGGNILPNGGVRFGHLNDINMDLKYDEVYLWDRRKDASVFSTLYDMDL